ncbi:hypothetical protein [Malikia sp.]|uniref:hypothetical protein n=1 Tax=Malikia sp. TaxID=2070706 RepID=UPI0026206496|nr:hypothetical protein [Malikia sp.]
MAQQPFEAEPAGAELDHWFGLAEAPAGQSGVELFEALTGAGAEPSAGAEADELAEVALEDEQAAQQELDEVLAEADDEGGEAVEPGLDELLALLKNRPGLKITLSY